MDIRRFIIYGAFYIPYGIHKLTRTGAFGHHGMVPLNGSIPSDGNPLKTGLIKHHVKQFHEASCSVAAVVSVINAIRDSQGETFAPITQMDILEKVRTANWRERMSKKGDNGKRGLPLSVFGEVTRSSLDAYGIRYKVFETVQARKGSAQSETIKEALWHRLDDFEKKGNCLILAHFDQGAYVPDLNIPHISPVGSFDAEKGMVTILDVDPSQEKPYRIDFDTFYNGLSSNYLNVLRPFGFGSGGYLYIELAAS